MIAQSDAELIPIKLNLGRLAYNLILEEYPLSEKHITQLSESLWRLECKVANLQGVARFVVGLLDDIDISESPELKQYITNYINQYFK